MWERNLAKSKYPSGQAPKSETVKNEVQPNGISQIFDGIGPDGKPYHLETSFKYDGKDYPITGDPALDTTAYTRVDENTIDIVEKKAGKVVSNDRLVFSKDGKTATVTEKQKDAKGQPVTVVAVYDKQ